MVSGIAVRYGDEARLWEDFASASSEGCAGVCLSTAGQPHEFSTTELMPLGILEWQDDEDALRFRTELSCQMGPRQDQMRCMDVRALGSCSGASLEFMPEK